MIDSLEEKRRFAGLMTGLADYYDKEVSKSTMALYWEGLKQYDYAAIEKAAWAHTQSPDENGRWMPKISDLTKVLQGSTKDQASIAWSKVDRAVRTIGQNFDVAFDDALIHRVIQDMGGWIGLSNKSDDDWPFVAKEFENRYRGYKMRDEVPEYPNKMIGVGTASAQQMGFKPTQGTVLIGDEQKAIEVIKNGTQSTALSYTKADALQLTNDKE